MTVFLKNETIGLLSKIYQGRTDFGCGRYYKSLLNFMICYHGNNLKSKCYLNMFEKC